MRISRRALASAWLRSTTWSERVAMALVVVAALGFLLTTLLQGRLLGERVGRPGWICGHSITKGSPFCVRDPKGGMSR